MEAGPELDVKIAQRVFGCQAELRVLMVGKQRDVAPFASCRCEDAAHTTDQQFFRDLPRYSRDSAAAITVFEAMVERIGSGSIIVDMEDARGHGLPYSVQFGDALPGIGPLPLAICEAALLALQWEAAWRRSEEQEPPC